MTKTSRSTLPAPRNILVCVSGMSPAVITETLYALVTQHHFVPDEVHVITTVQGKAQILNKLLGSAAQPGAFPAFMADYLPQGRIRFGEDTLHVIGQDGAAPLADIQSDDDNRQAANTIYRVLRQLKSQPGTRLHASVAGGRKSMSFYMGHAFSLVADADDQLSHVLVNEPFEGGVPDFFFPPRQPRPLALRAPQGLSAAPATIGSDQAKVQLALLSVLRLGSLMLDLPARARTDLDFAVQIAQATVVAPTVRLVWSKAEERGTIDLLGERIEPPARQFKMLALYALARCSQHELIDGALLSNDELWRVLMDISAGDEALPPDDLDIKKTLAEMRSKLKAQAADKVGPAARWLVAEAQGTKSGKTNRPYALQIEPACLELVNFPPAWGNILRKNLT